jgi:hypothetical protein
MMRITIAAISGTLVRLPTQSAPKSAPQLGALYSFLSVLARHWTRPPPIPDTATSNQRHRPTSTPLQPRRVQGFKGSRAEPVPPVSRPTLEPWNGVGAARCTERPAAKPCDGLAAALGRFWRS